MIIKSIELCNFRNYLRESFEFHPGTNVLFGDNAQGKTNVLEAIFVGGTTRSHKGSRDSDMINKNEKEAHIRYFVERRQRTLKVELHLRKGKSKGIAVDGVPIRNSNELLGQTNIIFFAPEDLSIVNDGPEVRRRFLDMELCQLSKPYCYYLTQYKKVLKQRNALLKQIQEKKDLRSTLGIWNSQLVEYGGKIIEERRNFTEQLNGIMKKKHEKLTEGREESLISYKLNCEINDLENRLFLEEDRDIYSGTTTTGPHRDDLIFMIGKEDLKKYGSQGQKKTAALSLKLAEIEIVENITGEKPILLLDDVLSELDRNRQKTLLENIKGIQTIITCTGLEEFVKNEINIDRTFEIAAGTVKEVK